MCDFCAGVRSCYDEGKRTAETLTMDYHRGADVQVRLFLLNHFCFCLQFFLSNLVKCLVYQTFYFSLLLNVEGPHCY